MPEPTETPGQAPELSQAVTPAVAVPDAERVDQLPKWAQNLIAETRREAAGHRTKLDAIEQAKADAERTAAEKQGEFKRLYEAEQQRLRDLEAQIAQRDRADLTRRVAAEAGLPSELAARLTGDDEAALKADAAALAKLVKPAVPGIDPTNPAAVRGKSGSTFDPKNPPRLGMPGMFKD